MSPPQSSPGLKCFKAYDVRGRIPDELNPDIAFRIGWAFGQLFKPDRVALGRDARHSGPSLLNALAHGLRQQGVEVIDLGLCGTEEIYFASLQSGFDGAIQVTASHNPIDFNGMKIVRAGAVPVSQNSGLREMERIAAASNGTAPAELARCIPLNFRDEYVRHLLSYVNVRELEPLKIVVNAGNGTAGLVIDALERYLPFELIKINHEPDGDFPNGIPNPLLPQNRKDTQEAVRTHQASFGIAWDGDFDRCFFFDEEGEFIESYYIVGLLARHLLEKHPGEKIIHDPRLVWNTQEIVRNAGGIAVQSKTGHAFIKERMRAENAVYGGEMSAHHYFRDFAYCDNGNIPWLLMAGILSRTNMSLSKLIRHRAERFPVSGEINFKVKNLSDSIENVRRYYAEAAKRSESEDGLTMDFDTWRFNLRGSNTEPLLRLNVESRADQTLVSEKTAEIRALLLMD